MTNQTRAAALTATLQSIKIYNEEGDRIVDFENQGRDALDFASLSRGTIERLLVAAYEAGRASM